MQTNQQAPLQGDITAESQNPAAEPSKPSGRDVAARVLVACHLGAPNDLVNLPEADAKAAVKEGLVDTSKAAVAYVLELRRKAEDAQAQAQ